MKRSRCASVHARLAGLLLACGSMASAQQSLETTFRITGDTVVAAFSSQAEVIQKSSAVFYNGRDEIAYGVVLSEDGYLFTKASEVEGIPDLSVRVDKESFTEVAVVTVDPRWDVALVKVDAKGLVPAVFAESSDLAQGTWVVVNGATSRTKRRVLAGVISANAREIRPDGGVVLGVELGDDKDKLVIKAVTEGGGAELAGMLVGDVVKSVDGTAVKDVDGLMEVLEDKKDGETVKVSLLRNGEEIELEVRLSARGELFAELDRNDQMSGDFSKRRSGFPRVIQHDILANAETMGGPVIDLEGRVVGMNIARANRAETFAIPVEELRELAERLMRREEN
ncbi:MAG: S1C family serine protease [Luteolibacter sp.]